MALRKSTLYLVLVVLTAGLIAGCPKPEVSEPPMGPGEMPQPPADTASVTTLQAKGSDTLLQVAQALAEAYAEKVSDVEVAVTGGGSGTGFQALIEGTTDIANASRKIKDKEVDAAKAKGIEPQENVVGHDGIAVIVNKDNPVSALTIQQLSDLYTAAINDWQAVGGTGEVALMSRDTTSGTYEYFREAVVKQGDKDTDLDFAASIIMLPSNSAIRDEVAKNTAAIGYIGLGYLDDSVKAVAVVNDAGAEVLPSVDTVKDGSYPISRPLFMYTSQEPSEATAAYMEWIMGDDGQAIVADEGFVPAH